MNGVYVDVFGKYNVCQVMEDVGDIKGMIKERKGKIEEMIIKNIKSKVCMRNNSNGNGCKGNNNVFNLFQKTSKTFNADNGSKYKTPFKQSKTKSMLMLLSPTTKRNNNINTQRSIESAFTSTKCSLFSGSTKNTKPTNVLSRFNTLLSNDGINNNKKHKPKRKRNITFTLTSSPSIPRTQSMFYTITTLCKKQYKRGLNISTSITNKYKRNFTQTRNKHIYKGNQQDIQALTETIINDDDLNTKQIVNLDIKHVDKLSTESVYKNRNLYINSLSHDNNTTNNGVSIYTTTTTHNNYQHNKSHFINKFRQLNTQKSFYIVERLLRLNTKYKDKLIKLTKRITTSKQQHYHQHRLQSV